MRKHFNLMWVDEDFKWNLHEACSLKGKVSLGEKKEYEAGSLTITH